MAQHLIQWLLITFTIASINSLLWHRPQIISENGSIPLPAVAQIYQWACFVWQVGTVVQCFQMGKATSATAHHDL